MARTHKIKKDRKARMTVILDDVLDQNLRLWCATSGRSKNDIISELLVNFLSAQDFQPDREPIVGVRYPGLRKTTTFRLRRHRASNSHEQS